MKHLTIISFFDVDDSKEVGDESAAAVDSGGKSKRTPPPWPSHLFAFPFERVVFIDR